MKKKEKKSRIRSTHQKGGMEENKIKYFSFSFSSKYVFNVSMNFLHSVI